MKTIAHDVFITSKMSLSSESIFVNISEMGLWCVGVLTTFIYDHPVACIKEGFKHELLRQCIL